MNRLAILILALLMPAVAAWAMFPFPSPKLQTPPTAATGVACNGVSTPSQLKAWFDASGLVTNTTNSYGIVDGSGNVSQWNDMSGNSNNATASAKPTLQIAATNGLNTVRFTGASSQYMTLTSPISAVQPFTMISVVRHGGPTGTPSLVELSATGVVDAPYSSWWFTDNKIYSAASVTTTTSSGTQTDTSGYHVVTAFAGSATGSLRFDRSSIASSSATAPKSASFTTIGVGEGASIIYYSNGDFAELCFYNATLGSTDYTNVENALRTKWGTP